MKYFQILLIVFFAFIFKACPPAPRYVVRDIQGDYIIVNDLDGNCYQVFNTKINVQVGDTVMFNYQRGVYKKYNHKK